MVRRIERRAMLARGALVLVIQAGGMALAGAAPPTLTSAEVSAAVDAAALALAGDEIAIAVVDRAGRPLAVFSRPLSTGPTRETALGLARTGAMFSNDQAPLSSRTIAFISAP